MHQDAETEEVWNFSPDPKTHMTTKAGRFFEMWSYGDLLLAAMLVFAGSTAYFGLLPWPEHSLKPETGLLDALYFTFVTFTSLGYGEYVPLGFGRVVAIFDVVSGLALTALLIGKFASERQSATLVLLHTSDCQRRISGFAMELQHFRDLIADIEPPSDKKQLLRALRDLQQLMEAISNYLIFNAMQARIVEFGNSAGLSILYRQLEETFETCETLVFESRVHSNAAIMNRAFNACTRIRSLLSHMCKLHVRAARRHDSITALLLSKAGLRKGPAGDTDGATKAAAQLEEKLSDRLTKLTLWRNTTLNPATMERIFDIFPAGPKETWGKHVHKSIAAEMGVTNSLVTKAIDKLIIAGRLPKPEQKIQKSKFLGRPKSSILDGAGNMP